MERLTSALRREELTQAEGEAGRRELLEKLWDAEQRVRGRRGLGAGVGVGGWGVGLGWGRGRGLAAEGRGCEAARKGDGQLEVMRQGAGDRGVRESGREG